MFRGLVGKKTVEVRSGDEQDLRVHVKALFPRDLLGGALRPRHGPTAEKVSLEPRVAKYLKGLVFCFLESMERKGRWQQCVERSDRDLEDEGRDDTNFTREIFV